MGQTFDATYVLLWVLAIIQAFLIVVLVHQLSEVRKALESPASARAKSHLIGKRVTHLDAIDLRSGKVIHTSQIQGSPTVLLFLSSECGTCRNLASMLLQSEDQRIESLVIYCTGARRGWQALLAGSNSRIRVLFESDAMFFKQFDFRGSPAAALVNSDSRVLDIQYPEEVSEILALLTASICPSTDTEATRERGIPLPSSQEFV